MNSTSEIKGWFITGTAPDKYQVFIDNTVYHTGTKSACIKSSAEKYIIGDYVTLMQQFDAKNYKGKRVRLSGFIRTENVTGSCGLWLRIDGVFSILKLDNMQDRPITGTTEWNHYSCVLDVPENGDIINIGILLQGEGHVWADNVSVQIVDLNTPTTDFDASKIYPESPQNLTFEE